MVVRNNMTRRRGGLCPTPLKKTAFVFAGGGSLGAVQVGILHELMRSGVGADFVVELIGGSDQLELFCKRAQSRRD